MQNYGLRMNCTIPKIGELSLSALTGGGQSAEDYIITNSIHLLLLGYEYLIWVCDNCQKGKQSSVAPLKLGW